MRRRMGMMSELSAYGCAQSFSLECSATRVKSWSAVSIVRSWRMHNCEKRVDRPDLHALSAAVVPQLRRLNVIVAIRHDQRQRRKAIDDLGPTLRPGEALQEFLQDEAGRQKRFAAFDGPHQRPDFGPTGWLVPPQRERPDAGVHEEAHLRWRSAL
jgi:hypothetical protein